MKMQFFVILAVISSAFRAKTNIDSDIKYLIGFPVTPKMLDIEWPQDAILMLKSAFCIGLTGFVYVAFKDKYVEAKKDTPTELN